MRESEGEVDRSRSKRMRCQNGKVDSKDTAVSGETDNSKAGSFLRGEVSDKLAPFSCWQSRASWEWAESVPDSFESWSWSRRLLAAPPVRGCWAGAVGWYTSSGRGLSPLIL